MNNYYQMNLAYSLLELIFEKYLSIRLLNYFEKYGIISANQFGFQKNQSTQHALEALVEKIYDSFNNKEHNVCLFIDYSKAFDTVNHKILLSKLYQYGIRGLPHRLFESYLENREQCVKVNKSISDVAKVSIGVPQGSILGPILFLVYINDFPKISNILKCILFADDTTLSASGDDLYKLTNDFNTELLKIESWTSANRLSINLEKTHAMLFSKLKKRVNYQQKIIFKGSVVDFVDQFKFLGVEIDQNLTFDEHINMISVKISKSIGIMNRIKNCVPEVIRKNLYFSLIYPYLLYGVLIWGGASRVHMNKMFILHQVTFSFPKITHQSV